jgi:hypothetical protein
VVVPHGPRCPLWVTGCRDDYIDLMAGVPQIAADLLQRASRQPWAKTGRGHASACAAKGVASS